MCDIRESTAASQQDDARRNSLDSKRMSTGYYGQHGLCFPCRDAVCDLITDMQRVSRGLKRLCSNMENIIRFWMINLNLKQSLIPVFCLLLMNRTPPLTILLVFREIDVRS